MERRDPKRLTGFSEVDESLPGRRENGAMLPVSREPRFEFDERTARERTIARLRLLWANRRFLTRVTGIAFLLSVGLALLIPNRYQSVAKLMPPDDQSNSGAALAAAGGGLSGFGGLAGQLLGLKSSSDLLVGVLESRTVADQLIRQFHLERVYGVRRADDARGALAARTDITVDRKSQIITVAVTDADPHRAAALNQAYVEGLNQTLAKVSTSSARRERIFLEERLQSVSRDLENAEKAFSQFASKNTAIDITEQGRTMVESAAVLQGQLIAARSELEGLKQIYSDQNVRVRSLQARITELQDQLRKIGGAGTSGNEAGTNGDLYPTIRELPLLGVPYEDLYRNTRIQETVLDRLTQEYELARVQEAKEIPTVKVLDFPNDPERKSFPPRTLIVVLATLSVLAGAMAWVFGNSLWKETDPSDPARVFANEVIYTVKAAMPWARRNGFKGSSGDGA